MIKFDRESHTYWYGDQQLSSVTQRLKGDGLINTRFFSPDARERGLLVHTYTELIDNQIAISPGELEPYTNAYRDFLAYERPDWIYSEVGVADVENGYAGIADRVGYMHGRSLVLDIKTGAPAKWHWAQLVAYQLAFDIFAWELETEYPLPPMSVDAIAILYLGRNGKYRLKWSDVGSITYLLGLEMWEGVV